MGTSEVVDWIATFIKYIFAFGVLVWSLYIGVGLTFLLTKWASIGWNWVF